MTLEDKNTPHASDDATTTTVAENVQSTLTEYLQFGETPEKFNPVEFVTRLENVVQIIKGLQGFRNLYKLNNRLENEVSNDLKEMEIYVTEMKAVLRNICRLKSNKIDINKELNAIKGSLEKKNKEEIQEMETVIAIYDKDLLKKWHVAKKTSSIQSMENFLNNLAGKKQALEHVYKMALDRLGVLKKNKNEGGAPTFHLRFTGPTPNPRHVETDSDSDGQFSLC